MWHSVFIGLHATAGVVAFGVGCMALWRGRWYPVYLVALLAMALFLVPAMWVGWGGYDAVTRIIFPALLGLAGFMVWRGVMAGQVHPARPARPSAAYVERIGFTLVGLADGFFVVTVLRMGGPGWALAATGIGIAIAGHFALGAARDRLTASPARAS